MNRIIRANIIDITGILIIALALLLISFSSSFRFHSIPPIFIKSKHYFLKYINRGPTFCINRRSHRRSHPNLCDRRTYPKMAS
jgi:hypothetical protein